MDHKDTALPDHVEQDEQYLKESEALKYSRPSDFLLCQETMTKTGISWNWAAMKPANYFMDSMLKLLNTFFFAFFLSSARK